MRQEVILCCMRSSLYIAHCSTLQLMTERKLNPLSLVWFRKRFLKPDIGVRFFPT